MLFNSIGYLIFLPAVIILYYAIPFRFRWVILLAASYLFYVMWKVEFAIVLITATLASYYSAYRMGQLPEKKARRKYLLLTLVVNLGMLVFFKYLGFFTDIVNSFSGFAGGGEIIPYMGILLPIGISFYTFQTIGYTLDVYRGMLKPEKNIGIYALFVSFFPLVLAGPIERGRRLLPQLHLEHKFDPDTFSSGLRLILWGFFKKIVIADRLLVYVQPVFSNISYFHGIEIAIALVMKLMQVYADFSGYTDIAIGSARLLGIKLSPNFNRPFIAQSIADFWSRWHISLTSWLRDYVYFSLPFKYKGKLVKWRANVNLIFTFVLVGFWHGPFWNFIIFGFLHGVYMAAARVMKPAMMNFNRITGLENTPRLLRSLNILATMLLLFSTSFFFGNHPLSDSFLMMKNLADFGQPGQAVFWRVFKNGDFILGIALVIFMLWFEYLLAKKSFAVKFMNKSIAVRYAAYLLMLFFILALGVFSSQKFFYLQF